MKFHKICIELIFLLVFSSCIRNSQERAEIDKETGSDYFNGLLVSIEGGLGTVRKMENGELEIWFQAPEQYITLTTDEISDSEWNLTVLNAMPGSIISITGDATAYEIASDLPTKKIWHLSLQPGSTSVLYIGPIDAVENSSFRIAVLSDIQEGIINIQDIFETINSDPEIRFVLSSGDLMDMGEKSELVRFQNELKKLNIPWYTTCGNHDTGVGDPSIWHNIFGKHSVFFTFKNAAFSLVDSASASIDPINYTLLDNFLDENSDKFHLFITHIPPVDPWGIRNGSFGSRKEAYKLIAKLAGGLVNLMIFGHIHTYYSFSYAGIDAHISGGGGGWPMKFDNIGRHFLTIDIEPSTEKHFLNVVRIP
ncbi:MAG: metallophosphoesterase [Deltaproteobacteria bacterium]|nr:metallophosphoesterase [Deltaproteobacteria bacterium]